MADDFGSQIDSIISAQQSDPQATAQQIIDIGKHSYTTAQNFNSGTEDSVLSNAQKTIAAKIATLNSKDAPYSEAMANSTIALIAANMALDGYHGEGNWFHHHNAHSERMQAAEQEFAAKYDHRDSATVARSILTSLQTDGFDQNIRTQAIAELVKIDPTNLKLLDRHLSAVKNVHLDENGIDATAAHYADTVQNSNLLEGRNLDHFSSTLHALGKQPVNMADTQGSFIVKGLLASGELINQMPSQEGATIPTSTIIKSVSHGKDGVHWSNTAAPLASASPPAVTTPAAPAAVQPPTALPPATLPPATSIVDKSADSGIALFDSGKTSISGQQEARLRAYMDSKFKGADGKPVSSLKVDFAASADKPGNAKINQEKSDARLKELERIALDEAAKQHVTLTIGHEDSRGSKDAGKSKGPDQMQRRASMVFHP